MKIRFEVENWKELESLIATVDKHKFGACLVCFMTILAISAILFLVLR